MNEEQISQSENLFHFLNVWWNQRAFNKKTEHHWNQWLPSPGNVIFTLAMIGLLILTQRAWASSNQSANIPGFSATTINYQGRLADDAGNPQTGTLGMSFAIWDAANGGSIIWGPESHSAVPVTDGLFNVGLGSQTSGGIPTTVWNGDRYLEVTVGGETLTPRELIRSVPIAGMALTAQTALTADSADIALTVPDGAIGSRHFSPSWYTNSLSVGASTTSASPVTTGNSITFSCETDCTALILHQGLVAHSNADGRVDVQVNIDGISRILELGVPNIARNAGSSDWDQVSGHTFANLTAGTHTVEVMFYCGTPGTCLYFGSSSNWEQLSVLLFAQQ